MRKLIAKLRLQSDQQGARQLPQPQYRHVNIYLSRAHNKIIIRPIFSFGASSEQDRATVLDFKFSEGELGQAIIDALDDFKVVSNHYWNTELRNKKPENRNHLLAKTKTIKKFERDFVGLRLKNYLREDGSVIVPHHSPVKAETFAEKKTHVRLLRSCVLDPVQIEELVICLHDKFIELFGPADQA